ncbi:MAG: glycosyltransferase [Planctomycetota bacterium]|jgi:glycosyltransferase involved in cell wall biosynthesis
MRVAFLTNIVSPYRRPVFDRLARTPGWTFRVFVNASNEFDRNWQVDTSELDVVEPTTLSIPRRVRSREPIPFEQVITLHVPVGLWGALRSFRPDAVISLEVGPRSLVAAAYCRRYGIPLIIWSYQSRISATQGHPLRQRFRRWLLGRADQVVGMGRQAREVLEFWGVPSARIVDAPNAANVHTLRQRLDDPASDHRIDAIRSRFGDGRRLALVVGRLVPLKGTSAMLDAWAALDPAVRASWRLVFVGHGPLEPLVRGAAHLGVSHVDSVRPEEIADWYAAADLHVFPSLGDVWGLVVNEAMACGVANLCSIHAGCCDDLIEHDRTGLAFDPADPRAAAASLEHALTHERLSALGAAGLLRARRFTVERLAASFRTAVERAVDERVSQSRSGTRWGSEAST